MDVPKKSKRLIIWNGGSNDYNLIDRNTIYSPLPDGRSIVVIWVYKLLSLVGFGPVTKASSISAHKFYQGSSTPGFIITNL